MPYHNDPNTQNTATAPYNFIELNDEVVDGQPLPDYGRFEDGRLSGRIRCSLCTESPIYVGGPKADNSAIFFHHGDPNRPLIPGSSLRGMIRNLVEIISFSKLWPISDQKLFYRDLSDSRDYQPNFVSPLGFKSGGSLPAGTPIYGVKVKAGILRFGNSGYELERCEMTRVSHDVLERATAQPIRGGLYRRIGRPGHYRYVPDWQFQGREVWVDVDPIDDHPFPANARHPNPFYLRFRRVNDIAPALRPGWEHGVLVMSGFMQNKHMEFVFLPLGTPHPDPGNKLDGIIERLESDEQISEWQQKAFEIDKPTNGCRRKGGGVRNGEPVFYLEDTAGAIEFIGRAQLFRLPSGNAPAYFRPDAHKDKTHVDVAESIFGFVDKPKPKKTNDPSDKIEKWTAAGRVFFGDATLSEQPSAESIWLTPNNPAFRAHILASPKPSAFAHYLAQNNPNLERRQRAAGLNNYRSPNARVRGHKLYWHRAKIEDGRARPVDAADLRANDNESQDQTSFVKPLRPGVRFGFVINFDNLTPEELGALLWALALPGAKADRLRHKLGMGKPLGMGSVHLTIDAFELLSPKQRYQSLFAKDDEGKPVEPYEWDAGYSPIAWLEYVKSFENWMTDQLGLETGTFRSHDRIKELHAMLSWPGLAHDGPVYMDLQGHLDRPILPNASTVAQKASNEFEDITVISACDTAETEREAPLAAGRRLLGTVSYIDGKTGDVFLEFKDLPEAYEEYAGCIRNADLRGKKYREDAPARVMVAAINDTQQLILCRPA